jgi:hypothetical protein
METLLFDRRVHQAVPATLLFAMQRSAIEIAAADWEPSIDAAIQRLALAGICTGTGSVKQRQWKAWWGIRPWG